MSPTKGAATKQRIVELAAPVFNQRGYVGASMRELVDATGLEKGGIYNHFGSKEQLALDAYDYAMTLVTGTLQASQREEDDAIERLKAMIRIFATTARIPVLEGGCPILNTAIEAEAYHAGQIRTFATTARVPVVAGGCPILNTAIEADDTNPALRDRARHSMTLWHRLIGRIVKDGKAAGTVRADVDPYDLASLLTASLEGGVMLSRLYDDGAYMDRVISHLIAHVETLRPQRDSESTHGSEEMS